MKIFKNLRFSASLKLIVLVAILSSSLSSCIVVAHEPSRHVVVVEGEHHDNGRHRGEGHHKD
jgi:hypothetical protein